MIEQTIFLPDWCSWLAKVYYAVNRYNVVKILEDLEDFGCCGDDLKDAERNLRSGKANIGLTYSNFDRRLSLMVIGLTDSPEQFEDTLTHERGHLVTHIAQALELDPYGEDVQYLCGEIARQMFPIAKKFLCEHCRQELKAQV